MKYFSCDMWEITATEKLLDVVAEVVFSLINGIS